MKKARMLIFMVLTFSFGLSAFSCQAAEKGLVAYWSFDKVGNDEVQDLSGNGFTGVVADAAEVKGVSGNALSFNGGCVEVQNNEALTPQEQLTVEFWFWTDVPGQEDKWMINNIFGDATYGFRLGFGGGTVIWQVPLASWDHMIGANGFVVPMGQWVFVAGTFDGKKMRIFVNGEEKGALDRPGPVLPSPDNLYIGSFAKGHDRAFSTCYIDEVKIYSRALAQQEIMEQYKKVAPPASQLKVPPSAKASEDKESSKLKVEEKKDSKPVTSNEKPVTVSQQPATSNQKPVTAGLVGWWKLDEGNGEEAKDSSGNRNDGEIQGGEWVKGMSGQALAFKAEENKTCVVVPDADSLNPADQISVEVWIKSDGSQSDKQIVNKIADGKEGYRLTCGGDNMIAWQIPSDEKEWSFGMGSAAGYNYGEWSYIVGTYDGKNMRIYINGKEAGSMPRTGGILPSPRDLIIGDFNAGAGSPGFTGAMSNLRIYSRALAADEILSRYNEKAKGIGKAAAAPAAKAEKKEEKTVSELKPGMLIEWAFNTDGDLQGWSPNGCTVDSEVSGGMLKCKTTDWDPFFTGTGFEFPVNTMQYIEVRMKATSPGSDEFFWSNTYETPYGGFTPGKETPFNVIGDNEFHIYRIFPDWKAEKKIILMRFDLHDKCEYVIDYIKVGQIAPGKLTNADFNFVKDAESWVASEGIDKLAFRDGMLSFKTTSGNPVLENQSLNVNTKENKYFSTRMAVDKGINGSLLFITSTGSDRVSVPLKADNKMHVYNIPMTGKQWAGNLYMLSFVPTDAKDAAVQIDYIKVCSEVPQIAELEIKYAGLEGAVNRAGITGRIIALLRNRGSFAKDVKVKVALPKGLKLVSGDTVQGISGLEFDEEQKFSWFVKTDSPMKDTASVSATGTGAQEVKADAGVEFTPSLGLPKADYVPAPQTVKTDYQVGVYYFPGWKPGVHYGWQKIMPYPEREPVLGWYREGEPEVADWHVKWCLEHGVNFFIYDWYWDRGSRQLEHALDALFKSKYGNQLNFCLLWANHNGPKSSSEKDCVKVVNFWINNYFKKDNYLKVDNKPVMVIFSPWRFREDMGSANVKAAFDKMRDICKENGFNGLYMVACSGGYNSAEVGNLVEEGYDAVSAYNWIFGMIPFEQNAVKFAENWQGYMGDDRMKFIVPVCGGWDARPWHGPATTVLRGRNPQNFQKHLQDAKDLLDKSEKAPKLKMIFIEAWNEFGEGSYIEPHKEFGFGYLDAIRNVFTKAPEEHLDISPVDVGLGPYDTPEPPKGSMAWEFNRDEGWGGMMALSDVKIESGCLKGISVDRDPAFMGPPIEANAKKFPFIIVSMKAGKDANAQIFWSTKAVQEMNEPASIHFDIPGDNKFHEVKLNVGENALWSGTITSLRFDPCVEPDVSIEIDYIKLSGK